MLSETTCPDTIGKSRHAGKSLIFFLFILFLAAKIYPQWVQTNGPYGGDITCFAVSETNLFAGTTDGIFLSTNNGISWKDVNEGLPKEIYYDTTKYIGIECLALIGQNLFAGTWGGGVFLSTNNGTNWTKVSSGLPTNADVSSFAVINFNLFAGTNYGVFLSTNNGTNWTKVSSGLPTDIYGSSFAVIDSNLFAGTNKGVFLTTDNGVSWRSVLSNEIHILAASGTNLFAGTYAGYGNPPGLFLSTNFGTSWTAVDSGLSTTDIRALAAFGENIYVGSWNGVHLSTNNGGSWTRLNIDLPWGTFVTCFANIGMNFFAGTGGMYGLGPGIFHTINNGVSWTPVNAGIKQTDIWELATNENDVYASAWDGVYLSTNNGDSWTRLNLDLPVSEQATCFEFYNANIFVGTNAGVFLSTNKGESWTAVNNGLTNTYVQSLAVSGTNLFAGTAEGVFLSTNNGTFWTEVNSGLTNTNVSSLAVSGTNLFAGTFGSGVFLSTNNGTSWTEVNSGLSYTYVLALAVSGTNLFAGTVGGVFLSTNNGNSWTNVNAPPKWVLSLAVNETHLFAGFYKNSVWRRPLLEMVPVELTLFTATVNGKEVTLNWSTATELNNQGFEVQRKFGTNDFATIGSIRGNGTTTTPNNYTFIDKLIDAGKYFYRLKQIDFNGTFEYSNEIEVEVRSVDKFTLEQNYPNPFNPTTTIGYVLQEKSNAKLTLLNALAEEIAVLVNEEQDKGYHKVEIDGSKLTSGVYFYRLVANNFVSTRKMLLLK